MWLMTSQGVVVQLIQFYLVYRSLAGSILSTQHKFIGLSVLVHYIVTGACSFPVGIGLCVRMQQNDSSIECERDGRFKPLQCRPDTGDTTTETPVATPRNARSRASLRGPGKGGRSASAREDSICRCVDPNNGTIIEGTEERVMAGGRRPDCRRRGTRAKF